MKLVCALGNIGKEYETAYIDVLHHTGHFCERCWNYSETVGQNSEYPTLCERCRDNLN